MEKNDFRILFIVPEFNYVKEYMSDYSGSLSLAIGYLSAILKQEGFQTGLIHLTQEIPKKKLRNSS